MTKTQLQKVVEQLPDDFEVESFLERVVLLEKISQAEREFAAGQEISQDEMEREFC